MRDAVRVALVTIAARFSDDAPSVDARILRARFSALDVWPADSQLGLALLAWIYGPGFSMGRFRELTNALVPDFEAAAKAVDVGTEPTLVTLGGIVRCALGNGGVVMKRNLDPDVLYWPLNLTGCVQQKEKPPEGAVRWTSSRRSRAT